MIVTIFSHNNKTMVVCVFPGMTLDQVHDILLSHGCQRVDKVRASDCSVDKFRQDVITAMSRSDSSIGVIINYNQEVLGQGVPYGHLSPLAGYDKTTDRVLILDTWPTTNECWARVDALHEAMNTIDSETGKTRGYLVVEI